LASPDKNVPFLLLTRDVVINSLPPMPYLSWANEPARDVTESQGDRLLGGVVLTKQLGLVYSD
jgi:hypothetical protein